MLSDAHWERLGIDVGEWEVPGRDLKIKFILFMDMATRYGVTETFFTYRHKETKIENTDMLITTQGGDPRQCQESFFQGVYGFLVCLTLELQDHAFKQPCPIRTQLFC